MVDRKQSVKQFPPLQADEPVTVVIPNYNGEFDIADAIRSAQESTYPVAEIILVDDGSTDGSVSFVKENFPEVRILAMGRNSGGMVNRMRNLGIQQARTRLVLLMDHDVVLTPSCLSILVSQMKNLPQAAVLTTRALYYDDPDRIYVDAQRMHFLCHTVAFHRDGKPSEADDHPKQSVGWGTYLIDKEKAAVIGFLDEDYKFGWGDDGEFHHKILLLGLGCYIVPQAVVYHKRKIGANRFYGQIHNRWCLIIETYAVKTILLFLPALVLYEITIFFFMAFKGKLKVYLLAIRDVVRILPHLLSKRTVIQDLRQRSDGELLTSGPIFIRKSLLNKKYLAFGMHVLNKLFDGYWYLLKRFI
jgi:GT2 family glycosyltransferase